MNSLNHFSFSLLLTTATTTIIAAFVFLKSKHRKINKIYALYMLSIAIWSFAESRMVISTDKTIALFWGKLSHAAILIPITFSHFVYTFLGQKNRKWLLITGYSICVFLLLLIPTKILLTDVVPKYFLNYFFKPGKGYFIFTPFFFGFIGYSLIELLIGSKNSSGAKRNQAKVLLLGYIVGYLGGGVNFLIVYNVNIFPLNIFYPYCNYTIPIHVLITAYAIALHRLMDINIAIRKIAANLLVVVILCAIVISLYILPVSLILKSTSVLILIILITMYIPKLKFLLEGAINRLLFGTKYDYQETLSEVSNMVPTIIDLHKLLKYVTDKICKSIGLAKGAILLKDDFGNKYSVQYQHGFDGEKASSMKLEAHGPLVSRIKNVEDVLVRHEMMQLLNEKDYNELCIDLDKFEAEVVVPIRKGNNVLGLLTLSDKAGGDTFGQEDFRLLHIIAIQAAVAIENIRLYNKLIHTDRQTFLETLASGVSHEMRNRLVAIRTFIDLFPERVKKEHVEQGYFEFRNLAAREMDRLTKIIDGLLSYSRSVSKGGEELKVNALIEESLLIIEPKLKDKDIKLVKNLAEKVTSIKGDKGRLLQVFINIMQNAIDAMEKGGHLTITSVEKDNEIEVAISDTGKGIDKEHLDAIFEPFFTTKHQGTGLGLSIVQRIVRDHNGHIRVESELGKGTTFFISFQKGIEYKPEEIKPKEKLGYWEVKKESDKPE